MLFHKNDFCLKQFWKLVVVVDIKRKMQTRCHLVKMLFLQIHSAAADWWPASVLLLCFSVAHLVALAEILYFVIALKEIVTFDIPLYFNVT